MSSVETSIRAALQSEDDLGKVIRAHILIESAIEDFLDVALTDASQLKSANLDYFQKLHIAIASGFRSDMKESLKFIGTMRNSFAHRIDQSIDSQRMNNWYKAFSESLKVNLHEVLESAKPSWVQAGVKWSGASPQEKFLAMSMSLYYETKMEILRAETNSAHNKRLQSDAEART